MSVAALDATVELGAREAAVVAPTELSPRTRALLREPIVPTLLRMAWPNVLVMVAQAATGLIETWFVSKLGTDALAGMALVFPGVMLMQMISAGAMPASASVPSFDTNQVSINPVAACATMTSTLGHAIRNKVATMGPRSNARVRGLSSAGATTAASRAPSPTVASRAATLILPSSLARGVCGSPGCVSVRPPGVSPRRTFAACARRRRDRR